MLRRFCCETIPPTTVRAWPLQGFRDPSNGTRPSILDISDVHNWLHPKCTYFYENVEVQAFNWMSLNDCGWSTDP